MPITLSRIELDASSGDHEAVLALADGKLFAILSCLGDLHQDLRGRWFVEAVFGERSLEIGQTFRSLSEFRQELTD